MAVLLVMNAVEEATTVTSMVTVSVAPLTRPPRLQVTVFEPESGAQPDDAESYDTADGSASVMTTPVASDGPLLAMVSV